MANNKVQTNHGVVEIFTPEFFEEQRKRLGLKKPINMIVRNDGLVCGFVYEDHTIEFKGQKYTAKNYEENIKKINAHPRYILR